jgi:hypothetical protein
MSVEKSLVAFEEANISAPAIEGLHRLQEFTDRLDRAVASLLGKKWPANPIRNRIIICCALNFAHGRILNMSHYQRQFKWAAARSSIFRELHTLEEIGIITLSPAAKRGKIQLMVAPSVRLVRWCNEVMPHLRELAMVLQL